MPTVNSPSFHRRCPPATISSLSAKNPATGQVISAQTVTVAVPKTKGRGRCRRGADRARSTDTSSLRPGAAGAGSRYTAKSRRDAAIAIGTVEMEERGGFFATGSAAPGAPVRLYLNGSVVGDLRAGRMAAGRCTSPKRMQPGSYVVRADQIDAASGKVVARAQVPFDYKATAMAEGDPSHAVAKDGSPNDIAIAAISTVTVVRGDNLWRISRKVLGRGIRYTQSMPPTPRKSVIRG